MQTRGILIEPEQWRDFQSVARSYSIEFLADRTDAGSVILSDTDIAEDILWAIDALAVVEFDVPMPETCKNMVISGAVMP